MTYRQEKRQLANLCDIQSGYTARGRLTPVIGRGVTAIQLRDLPDDHEPEWTHLPRYELTGKIERYRVAIGDVLFRSRGVRNTATVLTQDIEERPVAVQPLLILRPDAALIDAHYLAWFINHAQTQRYFDSCARGTNMRMIPKRCIEELTVAVPDLGTQRNIATIDALAHREHQLTARLSNKKLKLTNFALFSHLQDSKLERNAKGA